MSLGKPSWNPFCFYLKWGGIDGNKCCSILAMKQLGVFNVHTSQPVQKFTFYRFSSKFARVFLFIEPQSNLLNFLNGFAGCSVFPRAVVCAVTVFFCSSSGQSNKWLQLPSEVQAWTAETRHSPCDKSHCSTGSWRRSTWATIGEKSSPRHVDAVCNSVPLAEVCSRWDLIQHSSTSAWRQASCKSSGARLNTLVFVFGSILSRDGRARQTIDYWCGVKTNEKVGELRGNIGSVR
jgi:hypothetical protein